MMLHSARPQSPATTVPSQHNTAATTTTSTPPPPATVNNPTPRKRKLETQDNERLSKRLSLLNLEKNGSKLYVPVENPSVNHGESGSSAPQQKPSAPLEDDIMQLDDSKYKVYIYNIDDELSSDESDPEDAGKLVFLPDIEKHLRQSRIPPQILANSDGELAGMQMVLYSDPKSLTVPEDKDSVRKAIIESRHRLREAQKGGGSSGPEAITEMAAPASSMVASADGGQDYDDGEVMDID